MDRDQAVTMVEHGITNHAFHTIPMLAATCCALLLSACGGGDAVVQQDNRTAQPHSLQGPTGQPVEGSVAEPQSDGQPQDVPGMAELGAFLESELARLGNERSASTAPGSGTGVFNLEATRLSDVNEQVNVVELRWTSHLPGDYDGNGEVNASDLVPLAVHWNEKVIYRPAEEAGDVEFWPAGDRNDNSVGSHNWMLSHIDGNADGLVGLADVTTIAQHWRESITGYRLYRHIPLLATTDMLPGPDVDNGVTALLQDSDSGLREFTYTDEVSIPTTIEYYVKAWDAGSDEEGPQGNIASYRVNALPQAKISHTVSDGPEPYTVSLDASPSSDWDGGIASYDWDLDGDGSFELLDADSQLERSYMGGTALIRLRVTDTDGATAIASLELELQGSLHVTLSASEPEAVMPHQFVFTPATSGSIAPQQFEWYVNETIEPVLINSDPLPFEFAPDEDREHFVRLRVLGEDGLYREADVKVRLYSYPDAVIELDEPLQFLPATFTVRRTSTLGASPRFRLQLDGESVGEFSNASTLSFDVQESSVTEVRLEVRDKFGNIGLSEPVNASAFVLPRYTPIFNPEIDFIPYMLNYQLLLDDPDEVLARVRLNKPDATSEIHDEPVDFSGEIEVVSVGSLEIVMDFDNGLPRTKQWISLPRARMDVDFELEPQSVFADELTTTASILDMDGNPEVDYYAWDVDNDGIYEFLNQDIVEIGPLGPGSHPITLTGFNEIGSVSASHTAYVYSGDFDVAIIRNDAGTYDTNLNAVTTDLDSLGLDWQLFPYNDNILAELLPHGHFVVLWYRGGPADSLEPRQETAWTTSEIDSYIALLDQGWPLLMMSQNNSKISDYSDLSVFGGWEFYYGAVPHSYTVPDTESRHCWASAVVTDDGYGFGPGLFFRTTPLSFTADLGILEPAWEYLDRGENYTDPGSSLKRAVNVSFTDGLQYMGIGYSDFPWGNPPLQTVGLSPAERVEGYSIGHLSWGTWYAPYRNVGFWPNYNSQDHGNTRHWVIGYPWAAVNITGSEPPGMTRAEMLLNIIAWLKVDYDPQF